MIKHILQREVNGAGITETITPRCSCGWIGIGYAAHNDHQMTNIKEQEQDHIISVGIEVISRSIR